MKKIICFALLIMMLFASTAIAENSKIQYGNWIVQPYVDEFGFPTGEYVSIIKAPGTFDNSAVNDEFLGVQILCDYSAKDSQFRIGFVLFEYGNHKVLNNSTRINKTYNIAMMDSEGQKHYYEGYLGPQQTLMLPEDASIVYDAFMKGGTVRFYMEDAERTSNKYSFTIEDVSGFEQVTEMLTANPS